MSNFKTATQQKLRFATTRGVLSTEQLWDLPITELDTLVVELEKLTEQSAKKSFLSKETEKNKTAKLRFDVALEVLTARVEAQEAALAARDIKEHNERILSLITNKEDEALTKKSIDELKALLK